MADIRRTIAYGLLLNLFLFLTVRDLLVSTKSNLPAEKTEDEELSETEKAHIPQPKLMNMERSSGPIMKFLFCYSCGYKKAYEQVRTGLLERYPDITFESGNFDPALWRVQLARALSYLKIAVIAVVGAGYDPFPKLGLATPTFYSLAVSNKVYACLMSWFLTGMFENSLMSTGAFEIFYNDVPVWSKLENGRLPEFLEVVSIVSQQRKEAF